MGLVFLLHGEAVALPLNYATFHIRHVGIAFFFEDIIGLLTPFSRATQHHNLLVLRNFGVTLLKRAEWDIDDIGKVICQVSHLVWLSNIYKEGFFAHQSKCFGYGNLFRWANKGLVDHFLGCATSGYEQE